MTPLAGGAPQRPAHPEPQRPGLASLLVAVLLVVVPTGAAFAASSLPLPEPTSAAQQADPGDAIPLPPGTTTTAPPGTGVVDPAGVCPSGLFSWVTSPSQVDDCLATTLGSSVSWLFQYSVTTVTSYVAFNPLRGNYWQVYLWHLALLSVVAVVVAAVQWLFSLIADGAVEGMRSAGRSFVLLAAGLPVAFAVPFLLLLVDAGVLAVTGAFAGVFASRVTELAAQISSAVLIGQTPGALLAAVLLSAFLFPLLLVMVFAFVLRQIAVYAIPVYGQFGLLQAIAGDGGAALRTYFRLMAATLLFPLQFVDLLVIGVSFLDFSTFGEGFITLLYIAGVVLFALIGGSFLSLVFGTYAGGAAYAGSRRAAARRRRGAWLRPSRAERRDRPSRVEGTRLGSAAAQRWDGRRDERDQRRAARDAGRSRANPLYWLGPAGGVQGGAQGPGQDPATAGAAAGGATRPDGSPRTYGDRARERRGRRLGGSSPGQSPGQQRRGRSPRGPRP